MQQCGESTISVVNAGPRWLSGFAFSQPDGSLYSLGVGLLYCFAVRANGI